MIRPLFEPEKKEKREKLKSKLGDLKKNARQLKPIEECEVSLSLLDEKLKRERQLTPLSQDLLDKRALLEKKWCNFKREQHLADLQMLDRISYCQQKALDELQRESKELYNEAIQPDFHSLPFKSDGPTETPPIENYDTPDGEYLDVSKKW
ncbi:hypothetical protein NQ317_009075 [Molorchus minor]|uniref:Large ribosomal subunit protein mL40 n=1 Tax=Molorchus minor TaxID=1323400 RepID=A0ABQ9ISV6_9CUCU|nr:hypothetical protein NQ317_009075 [Molorchus minor]